LYEIATQMELAAGRQHSKRCNQLFLELKVYYQRIIENEDPEY